MYDWLEREGYEDEVVEPVVVMFLCEPNQVYLRPNINYRFVVGENCNKCKELANVYGP